MQVLVKTPRTEINGRGYLPENVLKALKKAFGEKVVVLDDDTERVPWREIKELKDAAKSLKPGTVVKIYRSNAKLSQAQLAKLVGLTAQIVSDIENHRRPMTLKRAQAFASALDVSIERFIHPTSSQVLR